MNAAGDQRALLLLLYSDGGEAADLVRCLSDSERYDVVTCPISQRADALLAPRADVLLAELRPDLVLLEPPDDEQRQIDCCESVRRATERPIVVLSRRSDELRVTRTLAAGVDEYLTLPIGDRELAARIGALARRMGGNGATTMRTQYGGLSLSPNDQSAEVDGRKAYLSPIEFRLISCLVSAQGKVVTHDALMSRVWGAEYVDSRHYLHLYIRYLREKLEADSTNPQIILSEWGIGYRLQAAAPSPEGS
ncbi:MAG: response regulator transcription factor [Chloroflexi bacterium]|nr:response regulator transcription factor [Chloroflexota bacterium]